MFTMENEQHDLLHRLRRSEEVVYVVERKERHMKLEHLIDKARALEAKVTACEQNGGHDYRVEGFSKIVHPETLFAVHSNVQSITGGDVRFSSYVCSMCGNRVSVEEGRGYMEDKMRLAVCLSRAGVDEEPFLKEGITMKWGRGPGYRTQHLWHSPKVPGREMCILTCRQMRFPGDWLQAERIDFNSEAPKCKKCLKIEGKEGERSNEHSQTKTTHEKSG